MHKTQERQALFSSAVRYFTNREYEKAYAVLFEKLTAEDDSNDVNGLLSIFGYASGCESIGEFYEQKIDTETTQSLLLQYPSFIPALARQKDKARWANYKRERNHAERLRFAVTAPLCTGEVLEIGCANGDLSSHIAMHATNVYGIDIDPVAIELARLKCYQYGFTNVQFQLGDGGNLSLPSKQFDTVVLAEVLEHVPEPEKIVKEAVRLCKPKGTVLISVPRGYMIPDHDHINLFTKESLLSFLQKTVNPESYEWMDEVPNQWMLLKLTLPDDGQPFQQHANLRRFFLPPHPLEPMEAKKVSVIVPTFNRCDYLQQALNSITKQTYKNIEIIVVNDGSTDGTEEMLANYPYPLKVISKENGGKAAALNTALPYVTGEYVWIFDDDDLALPAKLELQVRQFERNPDMGLIHTSAIICKMEDQKPTFQGYWHAESTTYEEQVLKKFRGNYYFSPTVIVKKSVLDQVGLFDENLIRAQDYDMWFRISTLTKVAAFPIPTIFYRKHDGIRGTKEKPLKAEDLQNNLLHADQYIIKKAYKMDWDTLFPWHSPDLSHSSKIEIKLERAIYLAQYQLVEECEADLTEAFKFIESDERACISPKGMTVIKHIKETTYHSLEEKGQEIVRNLVAVMEERSK
ncbi:glycosyltransferase [Sutcliffiella horikoshii]|uniref:Glycosyltransferase n=1 Tax=Sutcliffiella horikoshii TaxID=79883 RepID=A0A5D4SW75_9BACI|nr:glycosyltransferase [Sutcliffiella horikoshii]TYS67653.1 glycosyltransferase [Sutcliffiella horikoshii]